MSKKTALVFPREHWEALALSLPPGKFEDRYPTEQACRDHLSTMRWPNGPHCRKCGGNDLNWIEKTKVFACRGCSEQFSLTSGTPLHSTNIKLIQWFYAAHLLISSQFQSPDNYRYTTQGLMDFIGVSYGTAHRVRQTLVEDLSEGGDGFFRDLLCTKAGA